METKNKFFNIPRGGIFEKVAIAFVLFLIVSIVTMSALTAFAERNFETEYQNTVRLEQEAEQAFVIAKQNRCIAESNLSIEKLKDPSVLTKEDIIRLANKAKWSCDGF